MGRCQEGGALTSEGYRVGLAKRNFGVCAGFHFKGAGQPEGRHMTKILSGALILAIALSTAACATRTGTGAAAGAVGGAVVGGPVGAVVGGAAGATVGAVSEAEEPNRE